MTDPGETTRGVLRRTIGSATLYLAAQIGGKIVGFVYFLLLARWLDVGMFGILTYAATVALLADAMADLGMGRVVLREVARAPEAAGRLVRVMLPSKLFVSLALYAAIVASIAGRFDQPGTLLVFAILTVHLAATGVAVLLEQVLHAHGRFDYAAASHFVPPVVQLAAGTLLYAAGGGAPALAAALSLGGVSYLCMVLAGLRGLRVPVRLSLSARACVAAVVGALPFAAVTALILLSLRVEFFVLGQMADAQQIGWFGSASRLFEAALTGATAFAAVTTPRLVQAFARGAAAGEALYAHFARLLSLGGVAVALAGWVFAGPAVALLLPAAYAPATLLLNTMLLGFPLLALHLLNVGAMLALQRQRRPALLMTALVAAQAVIAATLIAHSGKGAQGAALALVVSAGLSVIASSLAVRQWLTRSFVLLRACLPAAAGAVTGAGVLFLAEESGLVVQVLALSLAGAAMLLASMKLPLSWEERSHAAWSIPAALGD